MQFLYKLAQLAHAQTHSHREPGGLNLTDLKQSKLDPRPLYAQVRDIMVERIRSQVWLPAAALPNEFDLARELGVSQGTVRKALDLLAKERLVVRRQGLGTFVVEHTPASVLFRFFRFHSSDGSQIEPGSTDVTSNKGAGSQEECRRLELAANTIVLRIDRLRTRAGKPFIVERAVMPEAVFPGLVNLNPIPNTIYDYLQSTYGVTVARAHEHVTAVAATKAVAAKLFVEPGAPLLRVDRTTIAVDGAKIEWRVSICHLADGYYRAEVM